MIVWVCVRVRVPFRFSASRLIYIGHSSWCTEEENRRAMNGELFKYKSLKFAVKLKVRTERLAMLYNYFFFAPLPSSSTSRTNFVRQGVQKGQGAGCCLCTYVRIHFRSEVFMRKGTHRVHTKKKKKKQHGTTEQFIKENFCQLPRLMSVRLRFK